MSTAPFIESFMREVGGADGVLIDMTGLEPAVLIPAFEALLGLPLGTRVVMFASQTFSWRAWGRGIVQNVLPSWELTHVIEAGGAYVPGQPSPTLVLILHAQMPRGFPVRVLRCVRGEPRKPADPALGLVWSSIVRNFDRPGGDEWTRCADVPRSALAVHPWKFEELVR